MVCKSRYLDPKVIFAFQRIFAGSSSKGLLIEFLNASLDGSRKVVDVMYNEMIISGNAEKVGDDIIDVLCTDEHGDSFFVGVQLLKETDGAQDPVNYGIRLVREQKRLEDLANLKFKQKNIYMVILVAERRKQPVSGSYRHIMYMHPFSPSRYANLTLALFFFELPLFDKKEGALTTDLDKWLYVLKNLGHLQELPACLNEPVFRELVEIATYDNLSAEEKEKYLSELKR